MNTARQMYEWNTWQEINWKKVEVAIFKLQKRIYRASQSGDVKLVHKLQRLLTTHIPHPNCHKGVFTEHFSYEENKNRLWIFA